MFSHVTLGISDFGRAFAFYDGLAKVLGLRLRFQDVAKGWAAWQLPDGGRPLSPESGRPLLVITKPLDGRPATPGNGAMVAFLAADRAKVDSAHAYALRMGGTDEGVPGLRPQYHADYYGAYFRDPDGNKLCVVCHDPV